jgi:hypothetical protein
LAVQEAWCGVWGIAVKEDMLVDSLFATVVVSVRMLPGLFRKDFDGIAHVASMTFAALASQNLLGRLPYCIARWRPIS